MKQNILCIDDEEASIKLHARLFNKKSSRLHIDTRQPLRFFDELAKLKSSLSEFCGLILDLRLDLKANASNHEAAEYRAPTLAQELRTRASEGELVDIPIFLWSVEEKYSKSYDNDDTAQDLFDLRIYKQAFTAEVMRYEAQMFATVQAYSTIRQLKKTDKQISQIALELSPETYADLDPRFTLRLEEVSATKPVHSTVRSLRKELIDRQGLLVDEDMLVSLLGINPARSADWKALLDEVTEHAGYKGVLSDGWTRWWYPFVLRWWKTKISKYDSLLSLPARKRISLLKEHLHLEKLEQQTPIDKSYSEYYSTICSYLKVPLDPIDGFLIAEKTRLPWQLPSYVSRKVLSNPAKYSKFTQNLEPHEQVRFDQLISK